MMGKGGEVFVFDMGLVQLIKIPRVGSKVVWKGVVFR